MTRKPYPSDVTDDEWNFVFEVFNGLRYIARCDGPWRMLPNDLPPWPVVYHQMQRWYLPGVFEMMVHDLRAILRLFDGRLPDPTAVIIDSGDR